jgi:hypothetical protein
MRVITITITVAALVLVGSAAVTKHPVKPNPAASR